MVYSIHNFNTKKAGGGFILSIRTFLGLVPLGTPKI